METYPKDPELKGIYVRRCKCGARPYFDRDVSPPVSMWVKCNCGVMAEIAFSKIKAIENWNNKKFYISLSH